MNGHVRRGGAVGALTALVVSMAALAGDMTVDNLEVNQKATVKGDAVVWGDIVMPELAPLAPIPTNGLKLHYTFDSDSGGQVVDASGNGNHGSVMGGVTYEAGKSGLSARFSNSSMHILCESAALNLQGATGLTVSLWAMPKFLTTYGTLAARGGYTSGTFFGGFSIAAPGYSGYPGITAYVSTSSVASAGATYAPRTQVNNWYHIAVTYDGTVLKLYVNGTLVSSSSVSPSSIPIYDPAGTKMVIGTCSATPYMYWGDQYFNGLVDDFRIYSRALAADEISRLNSFTFTQTGGSGKFDVVAKFPKGIGYVAPLGDLSMGTYTNRP